MKKTVLILCILLQSFASFCQSIEGWHIVEANCEWTMLTPSSTDLSESINKGEVMQKETMDNFVEYPNKYKNQASLIAGDVVFVINKIGDTYYCYNVAGRLMAIKGALTKVEYNNTSGVGMMGEDIQLVSGRNITNDFVWIVAQDMGKQTVTILLEGSEKFEVPQSKVNLLYPVLAQTSKNEKFKKVASH